MKSILRLLLCVSLIAMASACVGLDYPDYWDLDDSFVVNAVTLPIEILLTPVIFLLKLLPVL